MLQVAVCVFYHMLRKQMEPSQLALLASTTNENASRNCRVTVTTKDATLPSLQLIKSTGIIKELKYG
jgi:hypothetical protein